MGNQFSISSELKRLRDDYTAVTGEAPFNHFYCPILLEDADVELCAGHIINEGIPNSSRKCVVQRKDIDSFYGSIAESEYLTALRASGKNIHDFLEDESLRGKLRPELKVDGETVPYYEVRGKASNKHALLQIEKVNGAVLPLALKVSPDELPDSAYVQLVVDRDFTAHAVASLLKAAHLTMFSAMGYRYVFSPSGLDMARILGSFYRANPNRSGHDRAEAVRDYFSPLAGMVMPVRGFNSDFVKGSIEDGRFMACVGTSNKFYSLGVLLRTNDTMNVVFLLPDDAESMGTYMEFTRDRGKPRFNYHLAEFVPASPDESAYWKGYRDRFEFDPGQVE